MVQSLLPHLRLGEGTFKGHSVDNVLIHNADQGVGEHG
jgi:hypothetical protein